MENNKTTIKISKQLSTDLLILAKLKGKRKEDFVNEVLTEAIGPQLKQLQRLRFS